MDLRGKLTPAQIERACSVLDYQPFIITDDIQTGAAYSWMYGVETKNANAPFVFRREEHGTEEWNRFTDANARLRRMYDAFVDEIAQRFPGGTLLDFACNNGYFPTAAELRGMRGAGVDAGAQHRLSVNFLNEALDTRAEFIHAVYDSRTHTAPIEGQYTVVCASAIMCHLPDPLNFLAFIGSLATDAIFYSAQLIDSDMLLVSYFPPVPTLGRGDAVLPYRFNSDVRLSRGLLYQGLEDMGFKNIVELPCQDDWLPPYYNFYMRGPELEGETDPKIQRAWKLHEELRIGSKHVALIASR